MPGGLPPDAKIALLSPSGWGNLGDRAILESLLQGLRLRLPQARVLAFTLNAEGTAREHGIPAFTLLGFSPHLYTMREAGPDAASADKIFHGWSAERALHAVLRRLPLRAAASELRHLGSSRARLEGASAVVVAGGGQLDDFFGGALGQPYALLRWGLLARSVGARFLFASVGTGTLSAASRWLVLRSLRLAGYRSYRDDRSRELLAAPALTRSDPTVPDLAYGLQVLPAPPPARERLTIGLSPMAYGDGRQWPRADQERYRRHTRAFGSLAAGLLAEGHSVVLFTTDNEPGAVDDTLTAARALAPEAGERLRAAQTPDLVSLFATLAGVDLVVAARLHGTLLSHLAGRPVLAVSHERKVRTLMEQMGQARYCVEIDQFDAAGALALIARLAAERRELSAALALSVARQRQAVEAQYDALFGPPVQPLRSGVS